MYRKGKVLILAVVLVLATAVEGLAAPITVFGLNVAMSKAEIIEELEERQFSCRDLQVAGLLCLKLFREGELVKVSELDEREALFAMQTAVSSQNGGGGIAVRLNTEEATPSVIEIGCGVVGICNKSLTEAAQAYGEELGLEEIKSQPLNPVMPGMPGAGVSIPRWCAEGEDGDLFCVKGTPASDATVALHLFRQNFSSKNASSEKEEREEKENTTSAPPARLKARIEELERRVEALEKTREGKDREPASETKSTESKSAQKNDIAQDEKLFDIFLVSKEAYTGGRPLPTPGITFDLRFVGTEALGDRIIKNVKGTVWFKDAFGEKIVGATSTDSLGIGAGQSKVIEGYVIDWTALIRNADWKQVLSTDIKDLKVAYETDNIIFDTSVKLSQEQRKELQRVMNNKGFNVGTPDGVWGPASRRALQEFQVQESLEATGEPDRPTLEALGFQL